MTIAHSAAWSPTDAVEDLVQRVRELVDRIQHQCQRFIDNLNSVLRQIPSIIGDGIVTVANAAMRAVDSVIAQLQELIGMAGSPSTLRRTGQSWTQAVGGPVATVGGQLSELETMFRWQGPAADAYKSAVDRQRAAAIAVKTLTDKTESSLIDLASAITSFWIAVAAAVATFVVAVVAAVATAATVVGAPVAAGIIIAGVTALVGFVIAGVVALVAYSEVKNNELTAVNQTLAGDAAFPNGGWPPSTSGLYNDASATDGDRSDWRMYL